MSKLNINALKEHVIKTSLKLLKESQEDSLKGLEDTMSDIDEGLISLYEKKFDALKGEEKKAIEGEDFAELKRIKDDQVQALSKLIKFYEKKVEILNKISGEIKTGADEVGTKGQGVFSNKNMNEFKNEEFPKNSKLKISGGKSFFVAEKVGENNVYNVYETNIDGIQKGDFLKISDLKLGGQGTITVYRKIGDRIDELKTVKFNNVSEIIKNPS